MRSMDALYKLLTADTPETPIDSAQMLPGGAIIRGAERGFNERADVLYQAVDGTDLNDFWDEINQVVALRNQQRNRIIDQLTFRVTDMAEEVGLPTEVDFEVATEFGLPKGTRTKPGSKFWRGFDFNFYDLAIRYTWMFIAESDIREMRQLTNAALDADNRLVFSRIMRALFNPLNRTGIMDNNLPVTVYGFYNGDGEVPPTVGANTFVGTHNHYLTTTGVAAAGTLTPPSIEAMNTHLDHHGYTFQAGYKKVLWVNDQEYQIIRQWRVSNGAPWDFIPDAAGYGGGVFVPTANGQYVSVPSGSVPGQVGTYGPWHIVKEDYIPAGYLAGIVTGGPDNISNPIGLREHRNPTYRGLKLIPGDKTGYPLVESFYQRGVGTGVRHRGAGVVLQVSGVAAYATPAIYA